MNIGLYRAIYALIFFPLIFLFGLPFVVFIRILRPFYLIRVGVINNEIFGHFTFEPEYYLSKKVKSKTVSLDLFFFYSIKSVNKQWVKMVKRNIHVNLFVRYIYKVNNLFPGGEIHVVDIVDSGSRDTNNVFHEVNQQIKLLSDEELYAEECLKEFGFKKDDKFVCIISRDNAYKDKINPKKNWSYHNYRDSNIDNYKDAALQLADMGYFVFRIGSIVEKEFDVDHDKVIDYSSSNVKSDLLDIYLVSKCTFLLVGESGISSLAMSFRVPIVFVNLSAIEYIFTFNTNIISIAKKMWLRKEERYLGFDEIFKKGIGRFLSSQNYEELGIDLIENTPEEITDVAMEMHECLSGTWRTTMEEEVLQSKFWSLLPKSELHGYPILARIGSSYLKKYQNLL
jgi:putative glycosyltransferase (TIGR04372 family)